MTPLTSGDLAPSFTADTDAGTSLSLDSLRGGWVVLYFYPKDNTPGCTLEAQDFRDLQPQFQAAGARVLGVSPDSVKTHCGFRDRQGLNFTLLADPNKSLLLTYGVFGKKMMYGKEVEGVIRSTFLIDPEGRIARVWPKVSVKGHADEVLKEILKRDS